MQADSSDVSDALMESSESDTVTPLPKRSKHTPTNEKVIANRAKFATGDTTDCDSEPITRI